MCVHVAGRMRAAAGRRHAEVMKKLVDNMLEGGGSFAVEQ